MVASGVASMPMGSTLVATIAMLIMGAFEPARAGLASPSPIVRYDGGRLSVRIERVPLDEVIESVERTTGIVFHGELRDWREVSKRFDALPMREALARLIGKQNFVIRYGRNGRPSRVDLLDAPRTPVIRRGPDPAHQFFGVFARHAPVPVGATLSQALGTPTATLPQIAGLLRRPDVRVRIEATETLVRSIEEDRGLREGLHAVDDGVLARVVRQWIGDHAAEFVATVTTSARDPVLRTKFSLASASPGQGTVARSTAPRGGVGPAPRGVIEAAMTPAGTGVATLTRP